MIFPHPSPPQLIPQAVRQLVIRTGAACVSLRIMLFESLLGNGAQGPKLGARWELVSRRRDDPIKNAPSETQPKMGLQSGRVTCVALVRSLVCMHGGALLSWQPDSARELSCMDPAMS